MRNLLARLPRRISAPAYALLRQGDLRALTPPAAGQPTALLATHDLSLSGAPRVVLEIAQILRDEGYRVILLTLADGPMRQDFERLGVPVLVDRAPRPDAAYLAALAATARIALCNTVVTAALVEAWGPHVPTIWYLHEVSMLKERIADNGLAAPLAQAARVWAGSEISAGIARAHRADVAVFPYGLAPVGVAPTPGNRRPIRVGVFGSIEPRKGQDLLVAGLDLLSTEQRAQIDIRLFGRVLDTGFAQPILARAEADPALVYGGELDAESYRDAMLDVDAVLVCSRDDTLPLVSLDALGCGRILMLLPGVGTTQWMADGVDGLIARETSGAAVAGLLERLLGLGEDAAAMSIAARATFDRHFSQTAFRRRLLAEIDALPAPARAAAH